MCKELVGKMGITGLLHGVCENLNFGRILKLGECWGHGITSNEHAMELDRA